MSLAGALLSAVMAAAGVDVALPPVPAEAEALCGRYEQERTVPQLTRPLRSQGRFILSREQGLAWIQEAPFESLLVVDKTRMTQRVGDNPPVTVQARDNPAMFLFSRVLLQVFRGDSDALAEHFEVRVDAREPGWSMSLEPRASPLTNALHSITVSGGEYIGAIEVRGVGGDDTRIQLADVDACANGLSDAGHEFFELP